MRRARNICGIYDISSLRLVVMMSTRQFIDSRPWLVRFRFLTAIEKKSSVVKSSVTRSITIKGEVAGIKCHHQHHSPARKVTKSRKCKTLVFKENQEKSEKAENKWNKNLPRRPPGSNASKTLTARNQPNLCKVANGVALVKC